MIKGGESTFAVIEWQPKSTARSWPTLLRNNIRCLVVPL